MIQANKNFALLEKNYLFSEIAQRVAALDSAGDPVIKLGIGDVVLPLPSTITEAMHEATRELGTPEGFRGYGPDQGYGFLREAIAETDYRQRGVDISPEEIFVSDGAKCDSSNIQELFSPSTSVAIPDPVYPVYYDSNVIAGRRENIHFLPGTAENGFVPPPPGSDTPASDVIYLCYPNNPTGVVASPEQLAAWVEYAHRNRSLIVFDGAYERFITTPGIPNSIYEIDGAREVAVELRSFSKNAGFTGVRCAYTVVPRECRLFDEAGAKTPALPLWQRRSSTKSNGVSYVIQRAAEAALSPAGARQCTDLVRYYMENAALIRSALDAAGGYRYFGGVDSPYIWVECGAGIGSWDLFDKMLKEARVVLTPGAGFGACGEGYIRISSFNTREAVTEACARIVPVLRG